MLPLLTDTEESSDFFHIGIKPYDTYWLHTPEKHLKLNVDLRDGERMPPWQHYRQLRDFPWSIAYKWHSFQNEIRKASAFNNIRKAYW